MDAPQEEKTHEIPRRNEHTETVVEDILLLIMIIVGLKISVNILILALYKMKSFLGAVTGIFYGKRVDNKVKPLPQWMTSGHYKVTDYHWKFPKPSDITFKYVVEPIKLTLDDYHSLSQENNRHDAAGPKSAHMTNSKLSLLNSEDEQIGKHHHHPEMYEYHIQQHHRDTSEKSTLNVTHKEHHKSNTQTHKQLLQTEVPLDYGRPVPKKQTDDIKPSPGIIYREAGSESRAPSAPPDVVHPMAQSMSRPQIEGIQHDREKGFAPDQVNNLGNSSVHRDPAAHSLPYAVMYANKDLDPRTLTPEHGTGIGTSSHSNTPNPKGQKVLPVDKIKYSPYIPERIQGRPDSVEDQSVFMPDQISKSFQTHDLNNPFLRMLPPLKDTERSQQTQPDTYHNASLPATTRNTFSGSQSRAPPITTVDDMLQADYMSGGSAVPYGTLDSLISLIPEQPQQYPPTICTTKHVLRLDPLNKNDSAQQTKEDIYPGISMPATPEKILSESQDSDVFFSSPNDSQNNMQQTMDRKTTQMKHLLDETHARKNQLGRFVAKDWRPGHHDGKTTRIIRHDFYLIIEDPLYQKVKQTESIPKLPPALNAHNYRSNHVSYTPETKTYQSFTPKYNRQ
ncbi:uncharacterized protein [Ambystoma mexicanum]|uniref:uncharacterized protein isoform X1 n=1 Tax=Ambystoma mexicanum TaxID=8296 RepID=UPI0037E915BE